ncbi:MULTISPECIES: outer membrane lipoprotein carrier protein LolA [Flavobacterium]|uniref:Outer membrane lipoprotein carrier protein LolA n=1 Tax=Flavobacterium cupriresistens TaxID=2893885 RepID=A0ABU4RD60_9FLAO|nr:MULTISPECIES: outer membrane lipoprotein carrier protein LolA [unclassified Flavobacterium]KLT70640.1 cell envelope biogenesis protein LolA [Flavobacterium sp. ABG]MDX6190514.1 outer membrane lipoprotein carrier protein LolA [Flavobacterium sp. Fl-318]UFH43574.1 outer membrane lipoprotein carrier protein LolA [Flavobacterium sp. F-323]
MKAKLYLFLLLLNIGNIAFAQEQKMTDSEIASFKQDVNVVSKKIKSLTTDFVQYKHLDFLSKDIETSGKMNFKEPGLLQWQYKKPYNYSIVFKNGKILINDEGKKSAVDIGNSKIFGRINKLIIGSVSGNMFDDKEFSISYFKSKGQNIAKFIPKDATLKKYIKQIELTFDKEEATVVQVKLLESSEDYTRIVLKNKVINAKIDDSIFTN